MAGRLNAWHRAAAYLPGGWPAGREDRDAAGGGVALRAFATSTVWERLSIRASNSPLLTVTVRSDTSAAGELFRDQDRGHDRSGRDHEEQGGEGAGAAPRRPGGSRAATR